ncbi:STAS domain-containing protein [Geotalea uraniireducens]|nr:STAS domain-containing protein [Geotalea uraniireducens]
MSESATERMSIKLCGNWSITGVTDQLKFLKIQLQSLSFSNAADTRASSCPMENDPEIDMKDVDQIDLSGCQLLAIWLRHVKLLGLSPVLINVPEEFRQNIHFLGFGSEYDCILDDAKVHS